LAEGLESLLTLSGKHSDVLVDVVAVLVLLLMLADVVRMLVDN
jgi:hypothetical protein